MDDVLTQFKAAFETVWDEVAMKAATPVPIAIAGSILAAALKLVQMSLDAAAAADTGTPDAGIPDATVPAG